MMKALPPSHLRRARPALALAMALALILPAAADPPPRAAKGGPSGHAEMLDWAPEFGPPLAQEFRVIALRRAIEIASARFHGRVIAARLTGPTPNERARGAVLVQELRMLTPARDVLRIRLDARTGDFLEVAGRGVTRARKTRMRK